MRQHFEIEHGFITLQNLHIAFRRYKFPTVSTSRKLLCLHGSGVAGELTYGYVTPFLHHWSEILVPDLRGMGETRNLDGHEHAFLVQDLVDDVSQLLSRHSWNQFDLVGYSLGGLVSMMLKQKLPAAVNKTCLIEPALLDNFSIEETRRFRKHYKTISSLLFEGLETKEAVTRFLDLVSPNRTRSERSEGIVVSRLSHRPMGFANALHAVSEAAETLDRDALIAAQREVISLVGGKSYDAMKSFHQHLSNTRADWQYVEVPGADHSLPFQKPKRLVSILNGLYD